MKAILIIALICLIVGAVLIGAAWVFSNPANMNTVKDSVYEYDIGELPTQINIITTNSRVELRPIEGDKWKVACMDKENLYHTVELIDGVLTVRQIRTERQWSDFIGILNGFQNLSVIVYLPENVYESLSVHTTSGSIKVQEGLIFSNVSLQNASGSVLCNSRVSGALNVKNTSGSVKINGSVGGNLIVKNTSGSVKINNSVGGDLIVNNTSGSVDIFGGVNGALEVTNGRGGIKIKNTNPTRATVKSTSGSIDLINVVCRESCTVANTRGSIELEGCDAASFDLRTVSGSIKGSILSGKVFDCHSTRGSLHVPENGDGGTFKARTTSGGIRITIVE